MTASLNFAGVGAVCPLVVPLADPIIGTHSDEGLLEIVAGLIVLTTDFLAPVEVYVALVAVPEQKKKNISVILRFQFVLLLNTM